MFDISYSSKRQSPVEGCFGGQGLQEEVHPKLHSGNSREIHKASEEFGSARLDLMILETFSFEII